MTDRKTDKGAQLMALVQAGIAKQCPFESWKESQPFIGLACSAMACTAARETQNSQDAFAAANLHRGGW